MEEITIAPLELEQLEVRPRTKTEDSILLRHDWYGKTISVQGVRDLDLDQLNTDLSTIETHWRKNNDIRARNRLQLKTFLDKVESLFRPQGRPSLIADKSSSKKALMKFFSTVRDSLYFLTTEESRPQILGPVTACFLRCDGSEGQVRGSNLVEAIEMARTLTLKEEKVKKKQMQLFLRATELAKEKSIDISSCSSLEGVVKMVTDHEKDEFLARCIDQEESVDCDCPECGSWTVGEHRCSCGNCRMEAVIEGDLFSGGFYIRGERY